MLPDRSDTNSVIFRGIVKQVTAPSPALPPPSGQRGPRSGLASGRLRTGDPIPRTEFRYPTARFQILESFLGPGAGDFEVRLTSDHFLDGIPQDVPAFHEGEVWLVEAHRGPQDQQWVTSFCERTRPAAQAEKDLQFLRAWIRGEHLPAQVTGEVWNPVERKSLAGIQIYLRRATQSNAAQTFSGTTDDRGQFSFQNVDPGVYEAVPALPENGVPVKVDLLRARCRHVVFTAR